MFGMGFGLMTVESILDNVAHGQGRKTDAAKHAEMLRGGWPTPRNRRSTW